MLLDNAQDYEGAIAEYEQACAHLYHAELEGAAEDLKKIRPIVGFSPLDT